jgi:hypothetical protein
MEQPPVSAPGEDDALLLSAGPVQVLDAMPSAAPLLQAGASRLASAVISVTAGQLKATADDLAFFTAANEAAAAEYAKLNHRVLPIGDFFVKLAQEHANLKPHIEAVSALESAVAELEAVAASLVTQAKQLEAACQDVMQG